ncbi:MAG: hypothetical protein CO108_16290 [Deltaproteobacteria bacterium CG_4_9_14_3_um_filter_63_12]|nr:MAG: hypothetical protein COW42_05235 [Deltaproteobacteria bacterium CG17_big_fil_post_rev_8_21_14_2_50_63_7]PJB39857.1 MAG: hypothetical protein CO108_16290 [Deltaproteobacteria bacterium CG_4_9_14_3_um_filter_63_12]
MQSSDERYQRLKQLARLGDQEAARALQSAAARRADWRGRAEALLAGEPRRETWQALVDELDRRAQLEGGDVEWLEERLVSWPPHLRTAPNTWTRRALLDDSPPWAALARVWGVRSVKLTDLELTTLLRRPELQSAWGLRFTGAFLDRSSVRRIVRSLGNSVRALDLSHNLTGPDAAEALEGAARGALQRLELAGNKLGQGAPALWAGAPWPRLTVLDLAHNGIQSGDLAALTGLPWPALERLSLGANRIDENGVPTLLGALPECLSELDLSGNSISDFGAAAIASSSLRLTRLHLAECSIRGGGAAALGAAPLTATLHELDLWRNPLGGSGSSALFAADFPHLERLDVGFAACGDEALRVLARATAPRLRHLGLESNNLQPPGLAALGASDGLRALSHLVLDRNPKAMKGLGPFMAALDEGRLPAVTALSLAHSRLDERALSALAQSPGLSRLTELHLAHNRIDDAGVRALADSAYVGGLQRLDLLANPVSEEGVSALVESDALPSLSWLRLPSEGFSAEFRQRLASSSLARRCRIEL